MEAIDIYDRDRIKCGYTKLKSDALWENEFILIAHLVIFNYKGEMLIQKRAKNKIDWPDFWDISSGGGALAGETSRACAEREALEELGLKISLNSVRPVLTVHYPMGFDDYYIITKDFTLDEIKINKCELTSVSWADQANILRMQDIGTFVKYNDGFIDLLFEMNKHRGSYKR